MRATSLVPSRSTASIASSPNPQRISSQRSDHMKINISIGGKILAATLADNATARDFVSLLPLNVSMNDLFGREEVRRFAESAFGKWSQEEQVRSRRCRLLVSGSSVRCLLPPGWRVDTFARHHPDRKGRYWCRSIRRSRFGKGDH